MSEGNTQSLRLNISNIGPHCGEDEIKDKPGNKEQGDFTRLVFFAENGTGKSFISRVFRLISTDKQYQTADELLSFGTDTGEFKFYQKNQQEEKTLSVTLKRGAPPEIQDDTGYLFHVFNSDYVEENIKPKHFILDKRIEGYILGKDQIDLSALREKAKAICDEIKKLKKEIEFELKNAQKQLQERGVHHRQKEYALFNFDDMKQNNAVTELRSYEILLQQLEALAQAPEELEDVNTPICTFDLIMLDELVSLLAACYPVNDWDNEFIERIQRDDKYRNFIRSGVEYLDGEGRCPFCQQIFGGKARQLIETYKSFLADKETETLNRIDQAIRWLEDLESSIVRTKTATHESIVATLELTSYFPSLSNKEIVPLTIDEAFDSIQSLKRKSLNKKRSLQDAIVGVDHDVESLKTRIEELCTTLKDNEKMIRIINKTKDDWEGERRSLRGALCKAQFLKSRESLSPKFDQIRELEAALTDIQDGIEQKETRTSVREAVFKTLKYLLEVYFGDKYSIDEETFRILFKGTHSLPKASNVLSDGEKNVLAFCYFLASIHTIVQQETDYERLFFIIDDPISSMDYDYVYMIAQTIKDIDLFTCLNPPGVANKKTNVWVFTHNTEFLNILTQHFGVTKAFRLKPGEIINLNQRMIYLPYHAHLKDIIDIARKRKQPNHTTGNSIRHVVETLARFEFPVKNAISDFFEANEQLCANKFLLFLCNDSSHGRVRTQYMNDHDMLIEACKILETLIKNRYAGQLKVCNCV